MTVEERVAAVLRAHVWYFVGNLGVPGMEDSKDYKCACGWMAGGGIGVGEDPNMHVAAMVIEALGLTAECHTYEKLETTAMMGGEGAMSYGGQSTRSLGWRTEHRFVTPWLEAQ